MSIAAGPLAGVRIIDLTTVAMGPYATQILGDMGADVIKVESPDGDVFRYAAPQRHPGMGAAYLNLNRNKRSIVMDLKRPEERERLIGLVRDADVFVYNVRPQSMRKLGLDYESLSKVNPRIIHCGTYGFSEAGPYAGQPAFDDIIQAMSGIAALQGHNGDAGPEYVNTIIADKAAGLTAAYAIAMALYERERSGRGQAIEVPMFETIVSFTLLEHMAGETFVPPVDSMGYERVLSPHRKPYRTRDGYIGLLPYTTAQWQRFFTAAGETALAADPRVCDPATRSRNINALYAELSRIVAGKTTAEWVEVLEDADIPMTPVRSPEDLLTDPHLAAIDFFRKAMHPSEGEIRTIGIPVTFSRTPGSIRRLPPQLGEHRDEILREIAPPHPAAARRSRYFVRAGEVPGYHPANHLGTVNRRLIGRETVGAEKLEVVLGTIEKGKGALAHAHPGIEQVCYMLEGRARAEVGGETCELGPGDCCFFPPDLPHVFTVVSDEPVKVLVVYSPPYEESPERVVR
jgi:crotonobetainyl-CoA:carnitine CoA-transferase CaiB-like acyl-CoA transferase/uncharacterized RmlC-like cupin family protein